MTDPFTKALNDARRTPWRRLSPLAVGSVVVPLGLTLIGLAWLGASRTPLVTEQVAYLLSGGLIGLSLVVIGCFLYFSYWQLELIKSSQAQAAQVVEAIRALQRSVDRLEGSNRSTALLVATPGGTISHIPTCSVVRNRADLHAANGDLTPCRICQPV